MYRIITLTSRKYTYYIDKMQNGAQVSVLKKDNIAKGTLIEVGTEQVSDVLEGVAFIIESILLEVAEINAGKSKESITELFLFSVTTKEK